MILNYLQGINASQTEKVEINSEFVKSVKNNLHECSTSVELTIKNMDNMLGLRVQIANPGKLPFDKESGIDQAFLDAILCAASGDMTALEAYDSTEHCVDLGTNFKLDILDAFLESKCPAQVRQVATGINSSILEVAFQLGYRRKLRIYFSLNDTVALEKLVQADLIELKEV